MNTVKDLAKQMNVSESDVTMFAQAIANGIEKDKIAQIYIKAPENQQIDIVEGYAADAVIKFNNFQATLMTNKEAKDMFVLDVYNKLKNKGG